MRPYDQAWEEYHRYGPPGWPLHEVLAAHLHHGAVVCTEDAYILARRVNHADGAAFHLSPLQWRAGGDCWMVWLAAGRLESLVALLDAYPSVWVSFQRRDSMRLRRILTADFRRHVLAQNPQTAAAACAAGVLDRP